MNFIKKLFVHSLGHYIAALIMNLVIIAVYVGVYGIDIKLNWYNAVSVSGFVTMLIGALFMVAFMGVFDLFGYTASRLSGKNHKYSDYTQYHLSKMERRNNSGYYFMPYFIVGFIVFMVSFFIV